MQVNFTINIDDRLIARIKMFFTKRNTIAVFFVCLLGVSVMVYGATLTKTWNFSTGEIIDADKINKNFDDLFLQVNQLDGTPPGIITAYAGVNPPAGWISCDGASYDGGTDAYDGLFNAIGMKYGEDSGKFKVPDLRGMPLNYIIKL